MKVTQLKRFVLRSNDVCFLVPQDIVIGTQSLYIRLYIIGDSMYSCFTHNHRFTVSLKNNGD